MSRHALRSPTEVLTRGFDPALSLGSARPAVFRSSTYVFESPEAGERAFALANGHVTPRPGESPGLIYARLSHPNAEILEDQVVPLEPGARAAAVFNSGMAAISTIFLACCPRDTSFVYTSPAYGGTEHLIRTLLASHGIHGIAVPAGDTPALTRAIAAAPDLRIVFMETPANPTLVMSDIVAAVDAARERVERPLVVVDNTFLGPAFQQPLALGADLTVYSATKYLSGFSDLLAGVVLAADPAALQPVRSLRVLLGNILQPDECWMLDGRLPTVHLRMHRQSKSAQRIAEAVAEHPALLRVHHPALFADPEQCRIRDAQCRHAGAIVSFDLRGGRGAAFEFLRSLRIVRNAVSLGGVESLACHPASTTHSELTADERRMCGIGEGLVRLSVGVEDWRDLRDDVMHALSGL